MFEVCPPQISIWTNPSQRGDHAPTTMGESSGCQIDLLLALLVDTGGRLATVGYLGPPEADFPEYRQISYLVPKRPNYSPKNYFDTIVGRSTTHACLGPPRLIFQNIAKLNIWTPKGIFWTNFFWQL